MSATKNAAQNIASASKDFTSDADSVFGTPRSGGDSLYDTFGFEDTDSSSFISDPIMSEGLNLPTDQTPTLFGQSSLRKSLSEIRRLLKWIIGRSLVAEENEIPTSSKSKAFLDGEEDTGAPQLVDDFVDIGDVQDTCPACTTPYCQAIDSLPFKTSLKLSYNDPEMHTWLLGDRYIMTEAIDREPSEDTEVTLVLAAELLRKSTSVPIQNVMAGWKEDGKVITIVERVPGQRLYDIWWDLSKDQRERIANEVAHHVHQWRRLKADRVSSLSGGAAYHENLFGASPQGFGPFKSDEQLWHCIQQQLEDKMIDRDVIQVLEDYMPESAPCVFTHGDLSCYNILIHDGKVSAVLGFENAACLPVWAESIAVHFCYCKEDEQWKAMLSKHMKSYARAKDWWSLWMGVENDPSDKKRIADLAARCRRWRKPPKEKPQYDTESSKEKWSQEKSPRHTAPEPESQQRPPDQGSYEARESQAPVSTVLSKRLLKGRNYSELLRDQRWELAIVSQSEVTGGTGVAGAHAEDAEETDREIRNREDQSHDGESRGEEREEESKKEKGYDDDSDDDDEDDEAEDIKEEEWGIEHEKGKEVVNDTKHNRIKRWLLESERGRKAGEGGDIPFLSPAKEQPWRERQRSFERADNTSKGLRPFSLPLTQLSEGIKQKLREAEMENEEEQSDARSREMMLEKTLQSLESGSRDPTPVGGAFSGPAPRPDNERKRSSIFQERNTPGFFYLAVASAAAEGRMARRYQKSRSEERASRAEDQAAGQQVPQQRPRPYSLMPQAEKKL
ncbi:hypothetical protein GGR52DRAFT_314695 [Hypoxylon sp. FL1284]|nr:hypothetical protein GGR52DRAFT_314695 [Hypoxylon sp. FL1284]